MESAQLLYMDLNGRVACPAFHLGAEATAKLRRRPNAKTIRTTLTVWTRVPLGYNFRCEACLYAKTIGVELPTPTPLCRIGG